MSDRWQQNFDEVCAYIKEHKCEISDIPYDVTTSNGITMQNWLKEQYLTYHGRTARIMTEERKTILHDFGIEGYRNSYDNEFYKALMDVKLYYEEHFKNGAFKMEKNAVGKTTGISIFNWVQLQRRRYKEGILQPKYLQMIQEADMMIMLENPFDAAYRHAVAFQKTYGNLQMPTSYICEDGFRLGKWCAGMRDRRKKGTVSDDKIAMLDGLGFDWNTDNQKREINEAPAIQIIPKLYIQLEDAEGMSHAKQYYREHNDLNAAQTYLCADGFRLGEWMQVLRYRYRSKGVPLEIIEKLKATGFRWGIDEVQSLSEEDIKGLACAMKYSAYYHHLNVSPEYISDDFELGEWIENARTRYNNGTLPAELICKLQELYIIWDSSDIKWFYNFVECRKFIQEHSDTPVPRELVSSAGTMLNSWYRNNHRAFEKGTLSPVRAKLFSEIAVSPEQMQKNNARMLWDKHLQDVEQYLEQHPEDSIWSFPSRIAGRHISNVSAWLKAQIKEYHAEDSKLDEEQREKLRQLGIDDAPARGRGNSNGLYDEWQENCLKLKAFYEKHGHVDLPDEYVELKKWFIRQRGVFNRGAYSQKRLDFLAKNGITELFRQPLRRNIVKLNMTLSKEHYDALIQKIEQEGCQSIEEYLIKLAKS